MPADLRSWQDRIIYFVLTDRFQNGDPSNDDQGKGEFDPSSDDAFHGGDLKGLKARLPHIKRLGFDALWLTPPVHNQWLNPYVSVRGYHGYWAYDFMQVDPHLGTLEDYRALVREAHRLGLKVIQDIVVNHTGNFFTVDEAGKWSRVAEGPRDPVFGMNDPRDPAHKAAGVYNFTPNIADFKDRKQTLERALGDLDDVNLRSPLAARRMKEIYRWWLEQAGVDGFRVDTVYYTPEDFYEGFLYDEGDSPGIKSAARAAGKPDFFVFGEVWSYDYKAINGYLQAGRKRRLDSAIDLPLNEALTQVFYRGAATSVLASALKARRARRELWVNFLDNHDVERMHGRAGPREVEQSLVALFTLPGLPCVYYGTEAGLKGARQDMFDPGYFDPTSEGARLLSKLTAFRKAHPAFSRGTFEVERSSLAPGLLAWSRAYEGRSYWVVFNTAAHRVFLDLGGADADWAILLSSERAESVERRFVLPPRSWFVLERAPAAKRKGAPSKAPKLLPVRGTLSGTAPLKFRAASNGGRSSLSLLCNDDYDGRITVASPNAGALQLDTAALGNGRHRLRLLSHAPNGAFELSNELTVSVRNRYKLLADTGESRRSPPRAVELPGDPSYDGQLTIERLKAFSSGRDLRLSLQMARVTHEWNPPNGYDHVYFSVYFDFPGQPGKRFFPKLKWRRDDFEFNAGFLLYGWGGVSYGARDSTEDAYGAQLPGEVEQAADARKRTVTFTFSKRHFDSLPSFAGTKVLVTTWDGYLAELRAVTAARENWSFYAPDGRTDVPRVFDRVEVSL